MFDDAELKKFMKISDRSLSDGSGDEELQNICLTSSMLTSDENENSSQDVDDNIIQKIGSLTQTRIYLDKANVLDALFFYIGKSKVTRCQLETAPLWPVTNATEKKPTKSSADGYALV